ncbi:cysteine synthase B [Candidatus Falkowbacteria bacterium RBG_13_39_14]|uniref:cysteine synthase n=1 Tax=Candidatus Falkowbacteria bacterium RBG_13_39_14 TaxID=1797985 RepID=A0A1F5S749_9BACT|nr:MAG: cysteine synthase B [Candidatus Falkowbacteria bacterium RBG_13_39_14]
MYQNILQTIGNTPMVKINKLNPNNKVNIFAKIEGVNPGGSIKDRIALKMIEQAEANGLNKTRTIIEATSGNTGIALAMIGAVKGYKVEIVMSKAVSHERIKMVQAFGTKIILTDSKLGTDGAIIKVRELVKKHPKKYFMPDQFSNEYNKIAHYETTAQEIWKQTNGIIDFFVSSIGTSGTLMGVGAYLKKYNPNVKIISAEPIRGHYIQGLKNMDEALVPAIYDKTKIDEIIKIKTEDAFKMSRRITKEEGIFVGMSSGAAMLASIEIAKSIKSGNIVTIFPDRGEKYLSTELYA